MLRFNLLQGRVLCFDIRGWGVSIWDLLSKTKVFSFESAGLRRIKATAQTVHHGNDTDPQKKGRVLCKYTAWFVGLRPSPAPFTAVISSPLSVY